MEEEAFPAALGVLWGDLRRYEEVAKGRHQQLGANTLQVGNYPLGTALQHWHLQLKGLFTTDEGGPEALRGAVRTLLARHPLVTLPSRLEAVVRTLEALHPQRATNVSEAIALIHDRGPNPHSLPPKWREAMAMLAYAAGLAYGRPGAPLPERPSWSCWKLPRVPDKALFGDDDDEGGGGGGGASAPPAGPRR